MKSVSVIIPTYKNRGGLVRSIESVLEQDYLGLKEIIIVDDNDPESQYRKDTEKLMCQFSNTSKVIYLKHNVNKNGAAARNTGIRASVGDYIAFLDDDDIFLQGKISKQVEYLESHPEHDLVYCLAKGNRYGASQRVLEGSCAKEILLLQSNFFTPSLMFRRIALERLNGFDESFIRHQDYELLLRYFSSGYTIGCVALPLIEIGLNEGENILKGEKLNQLKSFFFDKFCGFIDREDAKTPGFKKKVYAKHYAGVFLNHVKNGYYGMAFNTFCLYFLYSPLTFMGVIWRSFVIHLKRNA